MIIAINLALVPVAFVGVMVARELRPGRRQLRRIRVLPELIRRDPNR